MNAKQRLTLVVRILIVSTKLVDINVIVLRATNLFIVEEFA